MNGSMFRLPLQVLTVEACDEDGVFWLRDGLRHAEGEVHVMLQRRRAAAAPLLCQRRCDWLHANVSR